MLDRPRHQALIEEIRESGARIMLLTDGDVAGAIATSWGETGVDVLFGIPGGTPEAVLAVAALKALGGEIQGKLYPRNEDERQAAINAGYNLDKVLSTDELVAGDNCFFAATGVTDGEFLQGVRHVSTGVTTQSLVLRSRTGTVRIRPRPAPFGKAPPVPPPRLIVESELALASRDSECGRR